jgi:glycogen phosphorylase
MKFIVKHPYTFDPQYQTPVAYFSMEFAIHQPLKTYAGGLGFLAGSHMRSAFELKQNMVGIGILWKYGYYDQVRKQDQTMSVLFMEKYYGFLQDTGIKFSINVNGSGVWVTAYYLPPDLFNTVPVFFLSTDLPENDYLSKTISHKLYDANPETGIAAAMLLGIGGAKLFEHLNWQPEVYHLNESHALPLAFYLYSKYRDVGEVKKHLVFTNHTPEEAGNKKTNMALLDKFGFFSNIPIAEIKRLTGMTGDMLDHTLSALRLSGLANAVSKLHHQTLCSMWKGNSNTCAFISITNAQNFTYWADIKLYNALKKKDDAALKHIKHRRKCRLFEEVAEQAGEIYDPNVLTIVFARRFTGYKRAELLLTNMERFHRLVTNKERPVQIIWAGKPYPMDYGSIASFDKIVHLCKTYTNCAILVGYELKLSRMLKQGADIWLNVPRLTHEASGTSGMTAAMNGALNVSIADGWFPEFAKDKINCFVIPSGDPTLPDYQLDEIDADNLYDLLENTIIPMYYENPHKWLEMVKNSMLDINPQFGSNRMAREYYEKMYCYFNKNT